jgi:predicted  nucleic acid-binding Zn-ribbon protein
MSLTSLFPAPECKPARELAKLGARRRELLARERDALGALDAAQAEHARLERVIKDGEAKALALGEDIPSTKAGPELEKLAREVDARTEETDKLGRALLMLDEEARNLVTVNADELVAEATATHDAARERIRELCAGLDAQAAELRASYVAVQAVLAAAGRNSETAHMRVPPSTEMLVREGGAPSLLHPDDRVLAA